MLNKSLSYLPCSLHRRSSLAPALTSSAAFAVDDDTSTGSVDLSSVRAKIKAGNYAAALEELRGLAEDTQQADVYNLMGYTLRKTGDYATSLTYYTKALELQPDYRPARSTSASCMWKPAILQKPRSNCRADQIVSERLRGASGPGKTLKRTAAN